MSPYALADPASVINLDHPGRYLSWSFIDISVANLAVIGVMVVIFFVALLVPFPGRHAAQLADPGSGTPAGAGLVATGHQIADRVHSEVLDALPPEQRQAFTGALTGLVAGLLAEPVECDRPVRRARVPG